MMRRVLAATGCALYLVSPGSAAAAGGGAAVEKRTACTWSADESAWFAPALSTWEEASARLLGISSAHPPWIVLYDQDCVWQIAPRRRDPGAMNADLGLRFRGAVVPVTVRPYRKTFTTPDGTRRSPTPVAATMIARDGRPYFLLALMRLWRERPDVAADPQATDWLTRVALHEMVHTLHLDKIERAIERLEEQTHAIPPELNDDVVEARFKDVDEYRRAFLEERDLFYRAALAADDAEARRLTRAALTLSQQRRSTYLVGDDAVLAELEEIFLAMEGVAEWFAFRAIPRSAEVTHAALEASRGNLKNSWSQAEGLALFLLIERFDVPKWQTRTLAPTPASPFTLLREGID